MSESTERPLRVWYTIPTGIYTRWDNTAAQALGSIGTTGREVYIPLRSPSTGPTGSNG